MWARYKNPRIISIYNHKKVLLSLINCGYNEEIFIVTFGEKNLHRWEPKQSKTFMWLCKQSCKVDCQRFFCRLINFIAFYCIISIYKVGLRNSRIEATNYEFKLNVHCNTTFCFGMPIFLPVTRVTDVEMFNIYPVDNYVNSCWSNNQIISLFIL